jgi:adenine-specific DNA-methyltransferase
MLTAPTSPTLSHMLVEAIDHNKRSRLGAVYTGELLANWATGVLASMLTSQHSTVVDPACGNGALLGPLASRGISVLGIDCDPLAIRSARRRVPAGEFRVGEGLQFLASAAQGGGTLDAIIANPPWGASLGLDRTRLTALGYVSGSGQADSWDLFVEGVLRAAKQDAPIVLIIPDALFLPEHRPIRQRLLEESKVELIARLGEGFFPGVYRGTVLVVARKGVPDEEFIVRCARLGPQQRKLVLSGAITVADAVEQSVHRVHQKRFSGHPDYRIDIDARDRDHAKLTAVETRCFPWDLWLTIGRGVELSKSGRVVRCPECGLARPAPRIASIVCARCEYRWAPPSATIESIVRDNDGIERSGWIPLIVGEDVDRHACVASRQIRMNVSGIRYKPLSVFAQSKLLVRKTGLGIKAAVDDSKSLTNQVVFHLVRRPNSPPFLLDYLAGVICSRVVLAWHLKRQGEIEWRSHPYITPKVIRQFPVPTPESTGDWAQAHAIAQAVATRRQVSGHDSLEDLLVERLVAGMFGLSEEDMQWVLRVIDSAQQLEPIRTLRLSSASAVSPLRLLKG